MWYYMDKNVRIGPIDDQQIQELVNSRKVNSTTYVWTEGLTAWTPARNTRLASFLPSTIPSISSAPSQGTPFQASAVSMGTPANKYNVQLLIQPPSNQKFSPVPIKEGRLPVIITDIKAYSNNAQVNASTSYVSRFISSLKESNLFLDAGSGLVDFGDSNRRYHKMVITAFESTDQHKGELYTKNILVIIAGIIFFPLFLVFLFLKYDVDIRQKLVVEFTTAEGAKAAFEADTLGRVQVGVLSNAHDAGLNLGGSVVTSNINSIMNQLIAAKDSLNI